MAIEVKLTRIDPNMPPGGYTVATVALDRKMMSELQHAIEQGNDVPAAEIRDALKNAVADRSQLADIKHLRDVAFDGSAYWSGTVPAETIRSYQDLATVLHRLVIDKEETPSMFFFSSPVIKLLDNAAIRRNDGGQ